MLSVPCNNANLAQEILLLTPKSGRLEQTAPFHPHFCDLTCPNEVLRVVSHQNDPEQLQMSIDGLRLYCTFESLGSSENTLKTKITLGIFEHNFSLVLKSKVARLLNSQLGSN